MTNFNMYSCLWFCVTSLHQWHTGLSPYQVLTVNISSLERKLVYTLLETQDRGICGEYGTIWEYDPPGGKWIHVHYSCPNDTRIKMYSDWNKYNYTITFPHHLQIWNISQRFIALMCFTKVTQSYFIVDNLQFKKILLHFRIIKGMPQRGQIPSCKCTTSHALGAQCNPVRKFTGTDRNGPNYRNGPERTLIIPIASSVFSYFDTVYMYRLIPCPIYDLSIFPQIVTPFFSSLYWYRYTRLYPTYMKC